MRIFPSSDYSLTTSFTPDEIENILLKKSAEDGTFALSGIMRLQSGIVFDTTFFTSYLDDLTYQRKLDDSAPPKMTVVATQKENYTLLQVTCELGHAQQSIFVIIMGIMVLIWFIVLGGVMMNGDPHDLIFPSVMIGVALLAGMAVMHAYVDARTSQSKRFLMHYLKARNLG